MYAADLSGTNTIFPLVVRRQHRSVCLKVPGGHKLRLIPPVNTTMSAAEGGLVGWMEIDESMDGFRKVSLRWSLKDCGRAQEVKVGGWWMRLVSESTFLRCCVTKTVTCSWIPARQRSAASRQPSEVAVKGDLLFLLLV